ncbi:MAG TPA: helix-turn-helix domain-containing protein [Pseudogracilibacillus sp.]|nr:helix-turn-helix domain-containing protein [Pseudogracilibacillus sp.]
MMKIEPIKRTTMTVSEAAIYLGVSRDLIYILVREKQIKHFKLGSRILFKREKLDEWMEQQMEDSVQNEH